MPQTGAIIPDLSDAEQGLLRSFKLTDAGKAVVTAALEGAHDETLHIAEQCRRYGLERGNTGAGLLIHRLRRGDHYELALEAVLEQERRQKITGWSYRRGSHGETWVRDPLGTDVPPKNYG